MKSNYNEIRRKTKKIKAGGICIGGDAPVTVQSMLNADTRNVAASVKQIKELTAAGCELVRVAVPDMAAVRALYEIKNQTDIPVAADIHYDYKLAVESAAAGADKIRINPGNIGGDDCVKEVVKACRQNNIPIRIGVNGGSLERELLEKYGSPVPEALFESAVKNIERLEKYDFTDVIMAIKASNIQNTVKANRLFSEKYVYPIHLGITESGTLQEGALKSAIGIGALLCDGIGDTLRVSLTADPVKEVEAAYTILKVLGVRENGINLISCPTCGRTMVNLIELAEEFERRAAGEIKIRRSLTVALMGCAVNGVGEAKEADIGIAGGNNEALLFKRGKIIRKLKECEIIDVLISEINGEI